METEKRRSLNYYMRSLHRDVGFFLVGLTIIYSISGVVLIYRDTDFLKKETTIEKKVQPGMDESELGRMLHDREFRITKTEGDVVWFTNGTYDKATGAIKYTAKELPSFLNKFSELHKSASGDVVHWFTTLYGVLLLFLAISSFWMFNKKTKAFRRGIYIAGMGIVAVIALLLL
jgi:hypothetical protein